MACGTPVIALRNDSVPEVASDGETDFMVESLEEMAAAVDRVGDLDPRPCGARVEQRFSAEATRAGDECVYQEYSPVTTE